MTTKEALNELDAMADQFIGHEKTNVFAQIAGAMRGKKWELVSERLPESGQVIACAAEHKDGGPMYWAGVVVETIQGLALMETRGERDYRFILTPDTRWIPLPNTERTDTKKG